MSASTPTYRYVHQIEFNHNGKLYSCNYLSSTDDRNSKNEMISAENHLKTLGINLEGKIKIVSYTVVENKEES